MVGVVPVSPHVTVTGYIYEPDLGGLVELRWSDGTVFYGVDPALAGEPDNPEADIDTGQVDAAADRYERDLYRPWGD